MKGKMKKVLPLLVLVSLIDYRVKADNCDVLNIGKIGVQLIIDQIPVGSSTINRLLDQFWPDDCAIRKIQDMIGDAIENSERTYLKQLFDGWKSTLKNMESRGDEDLNSMKNFHDRLNDHFFHFTKNVAFDYFREYATLKLVMIAKLKQLDPTNTHYQNRYKADARRLVEAGERMIKELSKKMWENNPRRHKVEDHWGIAEERQKLQVLIYSH